MENKFTAVFEQVDEWWIGYIEELPGANTQGKTLEEARENLKEAVQLIIEANRELAYHPGRLPGRAARRPECPREPGGGRGDTTKSVISDWWSVVSHPHCRPPLGTRQAQVSQASGY